MMINITSKDNRTKKCVFGGAYKHNVATQSCKKNISKVCEETKGRAHRIIGGGGQQAS